MERECKTLNLDECRTRADCSTRKKPKSDELMCLKKAVRAAKEEKPVVARKEAAKPRAASMTAAHKAQILDARAKLPFVSSNSNGSFCVGMTEKDCGKAKVACLWNKEAKDGTKAHCGRRPHGTKADMDALHEFNAFNYNKYREDLEEVEKPRELTPEEIKQARWARAAASANANAAAARAARKGMTDLCAGMVETDCKKPSVQMACKWTKPSKDGKRKGFCGKRTDSNLESAATAKEMAKKFAELDKKKVALLYGGKSDPVLRLFYGY
jgi:hypothetical protein